MTEFSLAVARIEDLEAENAALRLAVLRALRQPLPAAVGYGPLGEEVFDEASADAEEVVDVASSSKGEKTEGEVKQKSQSHGGWLPKTAKVAALYWKKDWSNLEATLDEHYNTSLTFMKMVSSEMKKKW